MLPRQIRRLQEQYQDLFGAELAPVAYTWAGSFAETRDGLPFIGRVPGMNPRLQFALCYGGNGITYSVHAGEMIRAGIEGREHALDDIFGFGRLEADLSAGRQIACAWRRPDVVDARGAMSPVSMADDSQSAMRMRRPHLRRTVDFEPALEPYDGTPRATG